MEVCIQIGLHQVAVPVILRTFHTKGNINLDTRKDIFTDKYSLLLSMMPVYHFTLTQYQGKGSAIVKILGPLTVWSS